MGKEHSLSDTDEGIAIFTDSAEKEIGKLDPTQSRAALTAIINCLDNPVPRSVIEKPYETCRELEQLRQGDLRLYVTLIEDVPDYNILWIFAIKKHRYRNLGKFDQQACEKVRDLRNRMDSETIGSYLDRNEALTLEDLKELKETL